MLNNVRTLWVNIDKRHSEKLNISVAQEDNIIQSIASRNLCCHIIQYKSVYTEWRIVRKTCSQTIGYNLKFMTNFPATFFYELKLYLFRNLVIGLV